MSLAGEKSEPLQIQVIERSIVAAGEGPARLESHGGANAGR